LAYGWLYRTERNFVKPLLDANSAMKNTMDAYTEVRHYMGNEQYKKTVEWLEALVCQHQIGMTTCAAAKLPDVQVRIKQLVALREALVNPGGASTGYTFD
jgi:hypothetical protein